MEIIIGDNYPEILLAFHGLESGRMSAVEVDTVGKPFFGVRSLSPRVAATVPCCTLLHDEGQLSVAR